MRLSDKYRPRRLTEVVGQAAARALETFCRRPYRSCWLLEGPPGTGKSASAHAVAEELGCTTLSKHPIPANKLNVELAQGLFDAWTRFLPMDGAPFHVVIIEEFERVVSQEVKGYLKTALDWSVDADAGLPARCVVVATSNNVEKIEPALLERFEVLQFSGGPSFAELAQERLAEIWLAEMPGLDLPHGWRNWGWQANGLVYCAQVPLGKRLASDEHGKKVWVRDGGQCALLMEMYRMHEMDGVPMNRIAQILHQRDVRDQNGHPWTWRKCNKRWSTKKIRKAIRFVAETLAAGREL